jgi:hypothetical protein
VTLRGSLLGITIVAAVTWFAFNAAGDSFRRSFGASENGPLLVVVPLLFVAILVSALFMPERRLLLHIGAGAAVIILGASIWISRETLFVASLGVAYAAAWLLFYARALKA